MSRQPNANSSTSWIPLWSNASNNSSIAAVDDATAQVAATGDIKPSPTAATSSSTSNQQPAPSKTVLNPPTAAKVRRNSPTPRAAVKRKSSTNSLATMSSGSWLTWGGKGTTQAPNQQLNDQEDLPDENEENSNGDDNEEIEDYTPDDNGDEIEEHVTEDNKRNVGWTFWSSSNANGQGNGTTPASNENGTGHDGNGSNNNQNNDTKEKKDRHVTDVNTILTSNPSIPSKQDSQNHTEVKSTENDGNAPLAPSEGEDDAVLYKPHDKTAQFQQINTHKNENLRENIIVPDWDSCLPHQSNSTVAANIFGSSTTANQSNAPSKIENWRSYLNQLSSRLGFTSPVLVNEDVEAANSEEVETNRENLEKEFSLLYERSYKLYGRSLAKLPNHKRACLPNYNKFYEAKSSDDESPFRSDQQSQLEDDANDPNSISISNDPMGNLLINHGNRKRVRPLTVSTSDIVAQKSGPLRKIKKILIIGVHGFFPTKMIRPLIGAPKGTSLKFANEAEKAVIRYCIDNNLINEMESNVSIQKIALEKEGKIFDRVSFFTEILQQWQTELNEADFIFVASHSQGCVVSIILLSRLIKMGILKDPTRKRIGILGMAGINNGPFYGVDKSFFMKAYSTIEHESLNELFELTKFDSEQSLVYKESMQIIINANVKLCFIGSINDQLVPLYSAMASHVFHPNIYRATYIDHSSQTPKFIQKLVSLCCQLQNLGYFDNNVIKEISTSLAGPMRGGGHSKIYNDGKVYDLGIKFILDTDDIIIPPTDSYSLASNAPVITTVSASSGISSTVGTTVGFSGPIAEVEEIVKIPAANQIYIKEYNIGKIGTNPYILPWCLRGLLFNIEKNWPNKSKLISVDHGNDVGKSGYDEINDLYVQFDNWKPETKALKDLKFRLNGLRASKL
ncbi:uncharacterized protein RJT20DRAFT_124987 [Scheffersomyces xylosifermentans]|uniref:uncharacterized protein n=1 Tax=Scheffersomyces xylosifermentans TaxID=1304137 RepID=UPI00315C8315